MLTVKRAFHVGLMALVMFCTAHQPALAQDDPVEFFEGLLQQGHSVDSAREIVSQEFYDPYVATELAVFACSPPIPEACGETMVGRAWNYFMGGIEREYSATELVRAILNNFDDEILAYGIAVFWCSPDAGPGCQGDPIKGAWDSFARQIRNNPNPARAISAIASQYPDSVSKMIAAAECGEATCWAEELADIDFEAFEEFDEFDEFEPEKKTERAKSGMQFGYKPTQEPTAIKKGLCANEKARRLLKMCKGS